MMIKHIPLLLLSLFLLPIIQTNANVQSITAQNSGTNDSILTSNTNTNVNNTLAGQGSLVQNNPGYAIYIPGSGFLKNTTNKNINASNIQSNSLMNPNATSAYVGHGPN